MSVCLFIMFVGKWSNGSFKILIFCLCLRQYTKDTTTHTHILTFILHSILSEMFCSISFGCRIYFPVQKKREIYHFNFFLAIMNTKKNLNDFVIVLRVLHVSPHGL